MGQTTDFPRRVLATSQAFPTKPWPNLCSDMGSRELSTVSTVAMTKMSPSINVNPPHKGGLPRDVHDTLAVALFRGLATQIWSWFNASFVGEACEDALVAREHS